MPTNFDLIKQFHAKFDPIERNEAYSTLLPRRVLYLLEETRETAEAAEILLTSADSEAARKAKADLVKELVDVLQVTYGFLALLKVDADAAYREVISSNMTKTPNPGGKAIKGEGYKLAEMEQFV